jgi:hypothetical protein
MAHDENDPKTRGFGALDATSEHGAGESAAPAEAVSEAISAPTGVAASPPSAPAQEKKPVKKKNRLVLTLLVATLGLAATAGSIAAYRFRDKHEKLAAFATIVDELSARPDKLVASLRETSVKWLGDAARPTKKPPEPPAPPPAKVESKKEPEAKPGVDTHGGGDRITWSAPPPVAPPAPTAAPAKPAPAAPPIAVAQAPEPPPAPKAPATVSVESHAAEIEALARRVAELEEIARSALRLAEQATTSASTNSAPHDAPVLRDVQDNVSGLEGRIDELGDEVKSLRDRLDSPKDESRLPREVAAEPPVPAPLPAEEGDKSNPAAIVVIAHSLQKALALGAPFASELAALAAQGADKDTLATLAPSAETGAPTPRALRASFHPLIKRMEDAADPKTEESLSAKLLHGASKLVKMRAPGDPVKIEIAAIGAKVESALEHDDVGAALAAFGELPEEAKSVARDWEQAAKHRLDAETAAASILSSAIASLGKPKGKS